MSIELGRLYTLHHAQPMCDKNTPWTMDDGAVVRVVARRGIRRNGEDAWLVVDPFMYALMGVEACERQSGLYFVASASQLRPLK